MKPQFLLALRTYPDATSQTMVANAVALARDQGADLTVCPAYVDVPDISNALSAAIVDTGSMIRTAEAQSRRHGAALVEKAVEAGRAASVELIGEEVSAAAPLMAQALARMARRYDLTLVEAVPDDLALTETILFETGRPILVYPAGEVGGRIDRVAVAWDGSRAAARALSDAHRFIAKATHVCLLAVVDDKPIDRDEIDRLAAVLTRAGLEIDVQIGHARGETIGKVLQQKAFEARADLLVMGGFGHSRLREFVLGGATRSVLADLAMPVLMSH